MANAAKLALLEPVRALIVGYPGSAKTGGLASLLNAGYKIRMLDFEGNYTPLLQFTKPEFLKNLDIVTLEDKLKATPQYIGTDGLPTAFFKALQLMDHWKYKDPDGTEVDLGRSKDWGCDTIVVLDSLTAMGEAAKRRAMSIQNKTPLNMTDGTWGLAMKEQEAFVERLTHTENRHHVIVLAHLKMVGPKDSRKGDTEVTQEIKQRMLDLLPTRLWPSALGSALPPVIGGHFPTIIEAKNKVVGRSVKRVFITQPREELDLKMPSPGIPAELSVETGLAEIFSKLAPPLGECAEKTPT